MNNNRSQRNQSLARRSSAKHQQSYFPCLVSGNTCATQWRKTTITYSLMRVCDFFLLLEWTLYKSLGTLFNTGEGVPWLPLSSLSEALFKLVSFRLPYLFLPQFGNLRLHCGDFPVFLWDVLKQLFFELAIAGVLSGQGRRNGFHLRGVCWLLCTEDRKTRVKWAMLPGTVHTGHLLHASCEEGRVGHKPKS